MIVTHRWCGSRERRKRALWSSPFCQKEMATGCQEWEGTAQRDPDWAFVHCIADGRSPDVMVEVPLCAWFWRHNDIPLLSGIRMCPLIQRIFISHCTLRPDSSLHCLYAFAIARHLIQIALYRLVFLCLVSFGLVYSWDLPNLPELLCSASVFGTNYILLIKRWMPLDGCLE